MQVLTLWDMLSSWFFFYSFTYKRQNFGRQWMSFMYPALNSTFMIRWLVILYGDLTNIDINTYLTTDWVWIWNITFFFINGFEGNSTAPSERNRGHTYAVGKHGQIWTIWSTCTWLIFETWNIFKINQKSLLINVGICPSIVDKGQYF